MPQEPDDLDRAFQKLDGLARLYADRFAQSFVLDRMERPACTTIDEGIRGLASARFPEGLADWLGELRNRLLESNPDMSRELASVPIIEVKSFDEHTAAKSFSKGSPAIYVDSGLLNFVWRMNKALLCEEDAKPFSRRFLVAMAIARQAVLIQPPEWLVGKKGELDLFPAPSVTFSGDDPRYLQLIGLTVEHESFIIAHELAHIELGHLDSTTKRNLSELDLHSTVASWYLNGYPYTVLNEFDADARALRLCVNTYGRNDRYHTEGCLMMIFRLFRYMVWLQMTLRQAFNSEEEFLFGARVSRVRQEIYTYGPHMHEATVNYLEWLETNMEPGALDGMELYKNILKEPPAATVSP